MGVLFFGLVVVHSNTVNGVHIEPFYSFKKKNKLQSSDKYFCCEVIGELTGVSYEMTTPAHLHTLLTKSLTI